MKIRQAIKKVAALTAGVTMLGATITGGLAADLSEYPAPFVKDGVANAIVVVGSSAATADVVGAIDVAASLQAAAVSTQTASVSGAGLSVVGGEDKDVALGASPTGTFKDNDIPSLIDTKIDFNDNDVDVHEEIILSTGVRVEYSLNTGADEELGDQPYLVTDSVGAIEYRYVMDDVTRMNWSTISDSADAGTDVLELSFLGKNIEIVGATNSTLKIKASKEYYAAVGDSINADGHTVTLINVGGSAAVVKVDGQTKTITVPAGSSGQVTFDEAGDYKVEVSDLFYVDEKSDRSATLALGDDITETVDAVPLGGSPMEIFGYSSEDDESDWLWTMKSDGTNIEYIGAIHNFAQTAETAPEADERPAVALGDRISLPNNYGYVELASLETTEYEKLTVQPKANKNLGAYGQIDVLEVTHSGEDELFGILNAAGTATENVDTVYIVYNNATGVEFWYEDGTDDIQSAGADFSYTVDATAMTIDYDTANVTLAIGAETWALEVDTAATGNNIKTFFGSQDGNSDGEFYYNGTDISGSDTSVLSQYGIKGGDNPEDMMDSDKLELYVPDEAQKAKVIIGGSSTQVGGATGSVTTDKVNPIGVGLGVLDSDATVGSQNMIVVGGPCVNTVAAELMGNPANCADGFDMGKAILKLYPTNGKTAMLVAGYSAQDTQGATRVLAQYDLYDLSGSEASVVVTSLSNIRVE